SSWTNGPRIGKIWWTLSSSLFAARRKPLQSYLLRFDPRALGRFRDDLITSGRGMRQRSQPVDQGGQLGPIFFTYRQELQSHSAARHGTLHHAIGPDGAIRHKKMKLGLESRHSGLLGLQEQSAPAHIFNTRNIVAPIALPID